MTHLLALALILGLAACGDSAPPPKPAAPPAAPPQAPAPQAKAPEIKAPEAPASPPPTDPNKELARRVKQALESDAKVRGGEIDVTAKDGRVTLWGTAASAEERALAAQIAGKVTGVASVDNQLKIVKGS